MLATETPRGGRRGFREGGSLHHQGIVLDRELYLAAHITHTDCSVCGREGEARAAVVSFLELIGLQAIVLHEQPNMGRHLLTKFGQEAELVTIAGVLTTDDDEGRVKDGELAPRARQNVIRELGYFLAHPAQPMVCALITTGLEAPSDFDGIVYIEMAADRKWEAELLPRTGGCKNVRHDQDGSEVVNLTAKSEA